VQDDASKYDCDEMSREESEKNKRRKKKKKEKEKIRNYLTKKGLLIGFTVNRL